MEWIRPYVRILIPLIVLASSGLFCTTDNTGKDKGLARQLNLQGLMQFKQGNHVMALALFNRAIKADSDNPEYFNNAGWCLMKMDRHAEALEHFDQALKLKDAPLYHMNSGLALMAMKKYSASEKALAEAIKRNADYFEALVQLGYVYRIQKMNKKAERVWLHAAGLKKDPELENNLGLLFMEKGNLEEAEIQFQKSLKLNSNYHLAHYNLGVLYQKQKRYERSVQKYQKALTINPKDYYSRFNLSIVLVQIGKKKEAIHHLKLFIKANPPGMKIQIRDARERLRKLDPVAIGL